MSTAAAYVQPVVIQGIVQQGVSPASLLNPENLVADKSANGSQITDIDTLIVQDLAVDDSTVDLGGDSSFDFVVNVKQNVSGSIVALASPQEMIVAVLVNAFAVDNDTYLVKNFTNVQPAHTAWKMQPFQISLSLVSNSTVQIRVSVKVSAPTTGEFVGTLKLRVLVPDGGLKKRAGPMYVYEDMVARAPFVVTVPSSLVSSTSSITSKTTRLADTTTMEQFTTETTAEGTPTETSTSEPTTTTEPRTTTEEATTITEALTTTEEATTTTEALTTAEETTTEQAAAPTFPIDETDPTLPTQSEDVPTQEATATETQDTSEVVPTGTENALIPTESTPTEVTEAQPPDDTLPTKSPIPTRKSTAPTKSPAAQTEPPASSVLSAEASTETPAFDGASQDDLPQDISPVVDDTLPTFGIQAISSSQQRSSTKMSTRTKSSKSTRSLARSTRTISRVVIVPTKSADQPTIASVDDPTTYNYAITSLQDPTVRSVITNGVVGASYACLVVAFIGAVVASLNPAVQMPQSSVTMLSTVQGIAGLGMINVDQSGLMQEVSGGLAWTLGLAPLPGLSDSVLNMMGQVPVKKGTSAAQRAANALVRSKHPRQDSNETQGPTEAQDSTETQDATDAQDSTEDQSQQDNVSTIEAVATRAGIPNYAIFITVFSIFLIVLGICSIILGSLILSVHLASKKQPVGSKLRKKLEAQRTELIQMTAMMLSRLWLIFFSPLMLVVAYQWYYAAAYEGVPIVLTVIASLTFIFFIVGVPVMVFYRMRFGVGDKKLLKEVDHHRKTLGAWYERYSPMHWITILFFVPTILAELLGALSDGGFFWNPYAQLVLQTFAQLFLIGLFAYRKPLMGKVETLVWLSAKVTLGIGLLLMIPLLPCFSMSDEASEAINIAQLAVQGIGLGLALVAMLASIFWPTIKKVRDDRRKRQALARGEVWVEHDLDEAAQMQHDWEEEVRQEIEEQDRRERTRTDAQAEGQRNRTLTGGRLESGMLQAANWIAGDQEASVNDEPEMQEVPDDPLRPSMESDVHSQGASTIASNLAINRTGLNWRLERTMVGERAKEEMYDSFFPLLFSILLFVGNFLGAA